MNDNTSGQMDPTDSVKEQVEQLIDQKRFEEARSAAGYLLVAHPEDAETLALLASIELNTGRLSVARRYMLEALRQAPDSEIARENLAYLDSLELQATDPVYLHRWLRWRVKHLDYPRVVHLETVGRCNAKCGFCPHPQLERKFDAMSDVLFDKILQEVSRFPPDRFDGFAMHAVNEPFMDRKIFDRLAAINSRVPHAQIGITTNMSVMPPRFFERIRAIRRLFSWNVSFNAANRQEYEDSMQIDFRRTVNNIRRLLDENRRSKFVPAPVNLSRVRTWDDRDELFVEQCAALFPEFARGADFEPVLLGRASWLGDIAGTPPGFLHSYPCLQWVNLTIHCNGVVPHCCVDAKAQFPFGDVNTQSILEIYNSPQWRNLRERVSARDVVYPCNTCNMS